MAANRCSNPNCEYFNRTLPNNAKVCPMCGTALGNVVAASPSAAATDVQPPPTYEPPAPQPQAPPVVAPPAAYQAPNPPYIPPAPASPPYTPPLRPTRPVLRLRHTSGREFHLPGEQGYIGRQSQDRRTVPEVDLTGIPNEGVVSRAHARTYWDGNQNTYIIVDNNSRNGTYLNGNPLPAGVPHRLNHGDSLQLGRDNLVCFTVSVT